MDLGGLVEWVRMLFIAAVFAAAVVNLLAAGVGARHGKGVDHRLRAVTTGFAVGFIVTLVAGWVLLVHDEALFWLAYVAGCAVAYTVARSINSSPSPPV